MWCKNQFNRHTAFLAGLQGSLPGNNFINVLRAAFSRVDPKSAKMWQYSQQCCFTLLGLMSVKAVSKMLMKLTPGQQFQRLQYYNYQQVEPLGWNSQNFLTQILMIL